MSQVLKRKLFAGGGAVTSKLSDADRFLLTREDFGLLSEPTSDDINPYVPMDEPTELPVSDPTRYLPMEGNIDPFAKHGDILIDDADFGYARETQGLAAALHNLQKSKEQVVEENAKLEAFGNPDYTRNPFPGLLDRLKEPVEDYIVNELGDDAIGFSAARNLTRNQYKVITDYMKENNIPGTPENIKQVMEEFTFSEHSTEFKKARSYLDDVLKSSPMPVDRSGKQTQNNNQEIPNRRLPQAGSGVGSLSYKRKTANSYPGYELAPLNIDTSNPYTGWDYLGDLGASMLSSTKPGLQAFGDASQIANKNRADAGAASRNLKAKIDLVKWQAENDWRKTLYEGNMDLLSATLKGKKKGKISLIPGSSIEIEDENGMKVKYQAVAPQSIEDVPENLRHIKDGNVYVKNSSFSQKSLSASKQKTIQDVLNRIDTQYFSKPENMESMINAEFLKTSYGGEYVLGIKDSEDFQEVMRSLRDANVDGIDEFASLLSEGNPDAAEIGRALSSFGPILSLIKKTFKDGIAAHYGKEDFDRITSEISKRSKQKVKARVDDDQFTNFADYSFVNDITHDVVGDVDFGAPTFQQRYAFTGATRGQTQRIEDALEDAHGVGIFNKATIPEGYSKVLFQRPEDYPILNLSQIELTRPEDYQQIIIDMSSFYNKLSRATNKPAKQIEEDILISYDDSKLAYGGEDTPGGANDESRYDRPNKWYIEPPTFTKNNVKYDTGSLRDIEIFWNGFKGTWFKYDNGYRIDIDIKQDGAKYSKPQVLKL